MKKLFILLVFIIPLGGFSQFITSPSTIYMIPPTSGCNGQWAIYDTAACVFPVVYSLNPLGCATIDHSNGDTLFLNLCSIPCNIVTTDGNGNTCNNGDISLPTGEPERAKTINLLKIYPNPNNGKFIINYDSKQSQTLFITDLTGKIVHQETLSVENQEQEITANNLKKGFYLVVIKNKFGKTVYSNKISIIE